MRTVALEEHFSAPSIANRIDKAVLSKRGYRPRTLPKDAPNPLELLPEIGEKRLKSMDDAGISVQVLSNSGPGPDLVPGPDGVAMARETNDHLAKAISHHPDRFAGFAALPLQSPDAAATELVRAVKELGFVGAMVHGTTEGRFLDHPELRRYSCRGGATRRSDLYPSAHSAGGGASGLLFRSAGRLRSGARNRRLGLAFGNRDSRTAPGALRRA